MISPYDADAPIAAAEIVGVARPSVPSSRGGDPAALGAQVQWVLDHVQGFCWPNADTGRLHVVGRAWSTAADEVDGLARHTATASDALLLQTAPEIPLAIEAVGRLDESRSALALQLATVGRYCLHYADDVERHRAEILDLVVDLLAGAVAVEGIGLVLGAVTAGLTTAGATALNAARISQTAPRILAVVEAQSTLARIGATGLELARGSLLAVTGSLARINGARVNQEMQHRFVGGPLPKQASSFPDLATAERVVNAMLRRERSRIAEWASGMSPGLVLRGDAGEPTGRTLYRTGNAVVTSGIRVVLSRDRTLPRGWFVKTAFPDPTAQKGP